MMHDLFDVEVPRQRHSATSTASAEAEAPRFKGNLVRVLKAFAERSKYGFTDEQGGDHLYMTGNTYRPLRVKLENLGLIIKTTATRKTKAGRHAAVYLITMNGQLEASRYE